MGRAATPADEKTLPGRLLELHKEIMGSAPGISSPEYQAFLYVADNEGARQRDVCEHLDIPQATASRILTNLACTGYDLLHCTSKGRHHELKVSPKGRQLLARLAVMLGCAAIAPAGISILAQFEVEPAATRPTHTPTYDICRDPHVFSCDVS